MTESDDVTQLRERVKTQLNVSLKPNEFNITKGHVNQEEERAIAKISDRQLTRSLEGELKQLLPVLPTIPVKITQYSARELFGDAPYHSKEIHLRTSEQMKQGSDIELPQFDPNFFSLYQIHCRFPRCPETKARNSNHSSKTNKEDLYLCPNHRKEMVDEVTKKCAEKGIAVNFKDHKIEDFNDYTSLIGLCEKAFQGFKEKASQVPSSSEVNGFLAEIFLNVRNFFIISNAVLNPDPENLSCILPPVYEILQSLPKKRDDLNFVRDLAQLLEEIMKIILPCFNVVYDWVVLSLQRNPGAQIGAGMGGAAGAILAGAAFGPALPMIALAAGIGFVSGGLLGGGIFNLKIDNHDQQHNIYKFPGNRDGSLSLQLLHHKQN